MTAILEVENVTKSYGATQALKGVSFSLSAGRTLAVVGDNGAGQVHPGQDPDRDVSGRPRAGCASTASR